jgi:hypothetical protein
VIEPSKNEAMSSNTSTAIYIYIYENIVVGIGG